MAFIRAVALDLDGTLSDHDHVSGEALDAIARVRDEGVVVVLATGRILTELDATFPALAGHFDAIVGENGAVLHAAGETWDLAPPVDAALAEALANRGIALRRGRVLLAGDAAAAGPVMEEVTRLGLDCQIVRNRGALMVLPAGVSKGTGLLAALGDLGISPHNAISVGDAENDLALLSVAEAGVAVLNALPSVKRHADVVTQRPNGRGVVELLSGPLLSGETRLRPARRRLTIGTYDDGCAASLPGADANVLMCGDSGSGKSYLAGLLAERWIGAGYSVLIVDMEGDYIGLERLHDVVVLGAHDRPEPRELLTMLRQRSVSVVLDLSQLDQAAKLEYVMTLPALVEAERAAWGMPHWILIDEAHVALAGNSLAADLFHPADRGYCVVTYHPDSLPREALSLIDVTIEALGEDAGGTLRAVLRERGTPERPFAVAVRRTPHRRHWHKYAATPLPPGRHFAFRRPGGEVVGTAGDLVAFVGELESAPPEVLSHHLRHGDFSRWILSTLQDRGLAAAVAAVERETLARQAAELQRARAVIVEAVEARYLIEADQRSPDGGVPADVDRR